MYKHYIALTEKELKAARQLAKEVKFTEATGSRRRVGRNGPNALSCYSVAKWFDWNRAQRDRFKTFFSEDVLKQAVQGWFLDIPRGKGFLDVMDYWVGKPLSGRVIATALRDQTIILDSQPVQVQAGEQIGFSLCTLHEIRKSTEGQLWACVMIRGCHTKVEG